MSNQRSLNSDGWNNEPLRSPIKCSNFGQLQGSPGRECWSFPFLPRNMSDGGGSEVKSLETRDGSVWKNYVSWSPGRGKTLENHQQGKGQDKSQLTPQREVCGGFGRKADPARQPASKEEVRRYWQGLQCYPCSQQCQLTRPCVHEPVRCAHPRQYCNALVVLSGSSSETTESLPSSHALRCFLVCTLPPNLLFHLCRCSHFSTPNSERKGCDGDSVFLNETRN